MNFYFLLALAFGAFTGVADVAVPRPATGDRYHVVAPLTSATTPRAPAVNC